MTPKRRVLVVGSCIADYCLSIARMPAPGETLIASSLTHCLGGKGANQAVALARLGEAVRFVSRVGADRHGAAFREMLVREGIGDEGLAEDPQHPTGIGIPMVLEDGTNAIVIAPSAALQLTVADVERGWPQGDGLGALLLQLEGPHDALLHAMDRARAAGIPVFLNPAPFGAFAHEALSRADVVVPNQVEAGQLLGRAVASVDEALEAARELRRHGPAVAVLTLGPQGAVVADERGAAHVPGFEITAVDTTGAGDAFCAGLVSARLRGAGWPEAVELANACGALACLRPGTGPAMPTLERAATFLTARRGD